MLAIVVTTVISLYFVLENMEILRMIILLIYIWVPSCIVLI